VVIPKVMSNYVCIIYDASAKIRTFFETQMYLDFFLLKKD